MKKQDPALIFSNSRLLAAVYYGLLSVVGTILIDAFLTSIGIREIVPLFKAILLGMVIASITGALFGKLIIHCSKPYKFKTFFLGFSMVLLSLPFFALGLTFFIDKSENPIFMINNIHDFFRIYLIVFGYSYVLFGFLLAIAAGFASMYLRSRFIYHVLHTDECQNHQLPQYIREKDTTKTPERYKTRVIQRKKT